MNPAPRPMYVDEVTEDPDAVRIRRIREELIRFRAELQSGRKKNTDRKEN